MVSGGSINPFQLAFLEFQHILKYILAISVFFIPTFVLGQSKSDRKNFPIEVKKIRHCFQRKTTSRQKEVITNISNRPGEVLYFDTLGNLVKQVGYGKIHNADLRVLDYVTINKYVNTNLVETITQLGVDSVYVIAVGSLQTAGDFVLVESPRFFREGLNEIRAMKLNILY